MASSGRTNNFGLNQWVGSDKPTRADYNSDNAKIDAALAMIRSSVTNLNIIGVYDGYAAFTTAHPTGSVGDYYAVIGETGTDIYTWDSIVNDWAVTGRLSLTLTEYDERIQGCEDAAAAAQSTADSATTAAATAQNTADAAIAENLTEWKTLSGAVAFVSADNPTGVITIVGDHTTKLSYGMKIRLENGGHTIYGKISKVPTYSSPNTTVTFWHEIDPTTSLARYLIATGDVTNFYYSNAACPFGFPVGDDSWSVYLTSTSDVAGTADGSYHAVTGLTLNVPIGKVKLSYCGTVGGYKFTATVHDVFAALSTSASAVTNAKLRSWAQVGGASGTLSICFDVYAEDIVTITEETPYYFLLKAASGFVNVYGSTGKTTVIKAVFLD